MAPPSQALTYCCCESREQSVPVGEGCVVESRIGGRSAISCCGLIACEPLHGCCWRRCCSGATHLLSAARQQYALSDTAVVPATCQTWNSVLFHNFARKRERTPEISESINMHILYLCPSIEENMALREFTFATPNSRCHELFTLAQLDLHYFYFALLLLTPPRP